MSSQLPRGWIESRLCDVSTVVDPNPKHRNPKYVAEGFPFVSTAEFVEADGVTLETRRRVAEETVLEQESRCEFSSKSIFFSRKGTIGKTRLHPGGRLALLDSLCVINPSSALMAPFLLQALRTPRVAATIEAAVRGVALRQISVGEVRELNVPIAPLNEQRRIVAKLEALQARSRRARAALEAVPPLLEKLRQSILAAAFRGDLTKEWRAQHPDVEPASELLKRIRVERRRKWEDAELAKMAAKGKAPTDDRWKARYKEPEPVDATGLPELPEGWCWASLDELLAEELTNGRSVPTDDAGFPVLRLTAFRDGCVDLRQRKGGAWTEKDARPFLVRQGDFLVSRGNGSLEFVGRGGLVEGAPDAVAFPDTMIRVRCLNFVRPRFLALIWDSRLVRAQIEQKAKTTAGIYKVSQGDLESIALPIPPCDEQDRVCAMVERLRGVAHVKSSLASSIEQIVRLEAAMLAKAFRGELVPQDPNDEPAEAMLARLQGSNGDPAAARGEAARRAGRGKKGVKGGASRPAAREG